MSLGFNARMQLEQKNKARKEAAKLEQDHGAERMNAPADAVVEGAVSQCQSCKHKIVGTLNCEAFPDGIPVGFLAGVYNHTAPFPGDHGILYEPVDASK